MTLRACLAAAVLAAGPAVVLAGGDDAATLPTAAEIVARNAAARGGVDAWRRIETMAWTGRVESANARGHQLSFLLEQKRPGSARFELVAEGQKSIRVHDGASGWKMRLTPGGKPELQPYSEDELKYARNSAVIDGPLMDYAAKGAQFSVTGAEAIGDRKAYVLDVKVPSGGMRRVWVDAETALEVRHDREYRTASGHTAVATVLYRDYRSFEGLMLPVTIETGEINGQAANKLVIERVALNPPVDDGIFTRPKPPASRRVGAVVVDTRSAGAGSPAPLPRQ